MRIYFTEKYYSLLSKVLAGLPVYLLCLMIVSGSIETGNSQCTATARMRGDTGSEVVNLLVNGNIVSTHTLTTTATGYSYSGYTTGSFAVEFINDNGNRDVVVDYVVVDGNIYQENLAVHSLPSCNSGENLYCNGSLTWPDNALVDCNSGAGIIAPPSPSCGSGDFVWDNNIAVNGCTVTADWTAGPCCNWTYTIPGPYPSGMTSGPVTIDIGDAVAWDGYCNRSSSGNQTGERFKVIFKKNGTTIWESPLTGDSSSDDGVATGVESAFWRGPLGGTLLPDGTDEIILEGGVNSVYPSSVCISYDECTSATAPLDWTLGCNDGKIVDVYGNGNGSCGSTPDIAVTIPTPNTVYQTIVEVAYKGDDPGASISVYDSNGNSYCLDKTTTTSWNGYVYSGVLPGNISEISHDAVTYSGGCGSNYGLQSMVVYAFRNTSDPIAQSGVYSETSGYNNIRTFSIPVPPGASPLPRDLTVRVPITELTNDGRYLTVNATANGVTNSTTIFGPDASLNTCCLNIIEVVLADVPSAATTVDIEVVTVNDALPGHPTLDGQSYIMAGFITVDQECVECAVAATATASPTQICVGESSTLTANGTGGTAPYTYVWNSSLGSGNTKVVSPTASRTYRVTVTDAIGCTDIAVRTVTVNPVPTLNAGDDVEICNGQSLTLTTSAVGGTSPYTYNWSNGLGSGSSKTVGPTSTTTYVITVTDSKGCEDTDDVKVTVIQNVTNPGVIAGDQSLCGGYDPSNISSTTPASGGSGAPIIYVWQSRTYNCSADTYSSWSNIAGATAGGYNPPAITMTTQYRRVAYRQTCTNFEITNVITKEVVEDFDNAGTIGNDESECSGYDPANIVSLTPPSGGCGGTIQYLWQTREFDCSTNTYGAFSNISNSNALTYNPGAITVTTQYRRLSRRANCAWKYSSLVTKEVVENYDNAGTIAGDESMCEGYNPANITNVASPSGGCGGTASYIWQKRDQTCGAAYSSWSTISGATALSYNPGAITITSQYRRLSRRASGCTPGWAYSNIITKEVVENYDNSGAIAGDESMCGGYNPANITSTSGATGGCGGSAIYRWDKRERNCATNAYGSWGVISGATATTYNPPAITLTTQYRRLARRSTDCSWEISASVTKEVVENYDNGGTIASDESMCSGYNPALITSTVDPSGGCGGTSVYYWQERTQSCGDGSYSSWSTISGVNSLTYDPTAITETTQYRRISRRAAGCDPVWVYSNVITKEVVEQYDNAGTIGSDESMCGGYNPANITNVSSPSGGCGGSPLYMWQTRSQPCGGSYGSWSNISSSNTLTYNPGAITMTSQYRRLSRRSSGCTPGWMYSNIVTKEVTEQYTDPGTIAGDEEKCGAYDPANITNATSPSGGCGGAPFYVWQQSEYNCTTGAYGAYTNIANSDALTYNPGQITVTTKYRRVVRRDDGCSPEWVISNEVVKTVVENFTSAGTIASNEEECNGYDPAMITSTALPVGDNCFGTVQYRWQMSEKDCSAGTWGSTSTVSGATSTTYNPGAITGTTRYRRQVRKLPCTAWNTTPWVVKTVVINYDDAGTIQANQEFCVEGNPAILTGTAPSGGCTDGTVAYQWQMREFTNGSYPAFSNISGATASTYDPSDVSVNTQYRRRVRKGSCPYINSNVVTITIKDNPVSGIDGPSTICAKEIVTFSANPVVAGATYSWTFEDGTPASSSTPSVNVEWMTTGVKEIELTVTKDGCSVTYDAAINITQEVLAVGGPDLDLCKGGTITIDGGGTPGGNYTWTVESGDPTSIDNGSNSDDVTVSPAVTTVYRLTVSQNGCTRSDFVTVNIDVTKNPVADAGDDTAQCIGEDFILGGAPTGTPPLDDPTAGLGYVWSPASLLNDETIANPTANVAVAGDQTFQVIVYSFNTGCSDTSRVTVTIEEKAKVGDFIWMDSDYDGIQDAGEMGLNGVKVDLLDASGSIVETTTTSTIGGQAGSYEFEVCKGQYRIDVDETDVDNKIVTKRDIGGDTADSDINNNGRSILFTLNPGDNDPTWDAGFAGVIDLSLVKTVNDNTPNVGDVVTYTIVVSNDGPNNATGVSVEDVIPNGLSNVTNISNGGSMTAGVINWTGMSIADGGSVTLTYNATVEEPGAGVSYENVAQVTGDDQFDIDSTPDNDDGDQSEDDEDPEEITPQVADLNLVKTVNDMTPSVGDVVTFTIVVANEGPDEATGVRVRDGLPNGYTNITNISSPGILNGPGTAINWSNRTIASGASMTFTFDAEVVAPGANTNYNNIARVQLSDQFDTDSTPGNAADTDGDGNIGSQDPDDNQDPDDEDDGDDAFVVPSGTISGNVSEDTDNDDVANDPISGVTITLTNNNTGTTQTTVTDSDGNYEFTDLVAGEYTITEQDEALIDPDYVDVFDGDESPEDIDDAVDALNDDSIEVTLDIGEDDEDNNFVEELLGTISGNVSEDTDNDDVANDPIEGVTITLTDVDAGTTVTTLTDSDGNYEFTGLEAGEYTVTEQDEIEIDEDYVDVFDGDESPEDADDAVDNLDDDSIEVTLTAGEDDEDNNFVEEQLGTISGTVSLDDDNDGTADSPQAGVTVTLTDNDTGATVTTVTDENGDYEFTGLEPGDYTVTTGTPTDGQSVSDEDEDPDGDASDTDMTVDDSIEVTLTPGEDDEENNFVDELLGTISGNVSEDTDNDDVANDPIEGVTITLTDVDAGTTVTTLTDENGDYEFTGLEAGEYTVTEQDETEIDEGYVDVFDGDESPEDADDAVDNLDDDSIEVTLTAGEDDEDNNFVEEQLGTISGTVSLDDDNDGTADSPQAGVTVTLTDNDTGATVTTVTDENGDYEFTGLEPGDYTVTTGTPTDGQSVSDEDEDPDGDASDTDMTVDDSIEVTLTPGEDDEDNNFVDELLGTISGNVSEDTDNDDVANDPIEGVTITLTDVDAGTTVTTLTDENGDYEFTGLEAGEYTVTEQDESEIDEDYVDVFDGDESPDDADDAVDNLDDDSIEVTLTAGEDDEDNNFVEEQLGTIRGTVSLDDDNDGTADSPQAGVTVTLTDNDTGATVTTVTDENGDYEFTGLEPGDYTVTTGTPTDGQSVSDEDEDPDGDASDTDMTVDDSIEVTLTPGEDDEENNFVDELLGTISGNVSEDTDNDDVANDPIEGVTITLTDVDAGTTVTTLTDENGDYEFTGLEAGEYTVTEQDESEIDEDYVDVFDGDESPEDADDAVDNLDDDSIEVTLTAGEDDEDNNFVEEQLGTISGTVSLDDDNDGTADSPQAGVTVTLTNDAGATVSTLTDENGDYEFTGLEPGDYTVTTGTPTDGQSVSDEDEDPDGDASDTDMTVDDSIEVTLTPGEDDEENNFVDELLVSLGDFVWEDTNGDGLQDPSEDGLNGITVNLVQNGVVIATTMTADNVGGESGYYAFTDLAPGDYQVLFEVPTGFELTTQDVTGADMDATDVGNDSDADPTTGLSHVVTLTNGENESKIDAGVYGQLSLGDLIWIDLDNNGELDANEDPMPGVIVTLWEDLNGSGLPDAMVLNMDGTPKRETTDGNGNYLFERLSPGDYIVQVGPENFVAGAPLDGFESSLESDPAPDPDDVNTNNKDTGYNPGLLLGIISNAVTLTPGGEPVNDGDTDNNTNLTVDFGFYEPVRLGNYVWDDINGDGIQDDDEEGINDVEVILYTEGGVEVARDTTMQNPAFPDEQGYYQFEGLAPGGYYLEFGPAIGLIATMQDEGGNDATDSDVSGANGPNTTNVVTLMAGDDNQTIDAGFFLPASVGDYVWIDNGDFVQGPGDVGINGVVVNLFNTDDPSVPFATMLTMTNPMDGNQDGYYLFDSLPVGNYYVQFELPEGYSFVAPNQITPDPTDVDDENDSDVINFSEGLTGAFSLVRGQNIRDVDAGLRPPVLPIDIIDFYGRYIEDQEHNALNWITDVEINNDYFILERSFEGQDFEVVAEIKGGGNNNARTTYGYNDREVKRSGLFTYRLSQVDFDGTSSTIEKVVRINIEKGGDVTADIYPNPAIEFVRVNITSSEANEAKIGLYDNQGRLAIQQVINTEVLVGDNEISIPVEELPSATYIVRVQIGDKLFTKKLLVIK